MSEGDHPGEPYGAPATTSLGSGGTWVAVLTPDEEAEAQRGERA